VGLKKLKSFFIKSKKSAALVEPLVRDLQIKTPTLETEVIYLSGGNQQKVVLAKWLYTDQEIYILDEPTRGIDVNAKTEFYKLMSGLTENGKSILLVSSDMPELISMSDRILVIRHGAIADELERENINEHEIVKRALGVDV
jgi:ABC-type sugar transport system ATPase subunit